ncbi:MAG: magnesium transporter CorA family protein [Candidatus Komeilibacteria bacterium]
MLKIYHNSKVNRKWKRSKQWLRSAWVAAIAPADAELEDLSKHLQLPVDILQDSLDEYELPRLRVVGKNLVVILRAAWQEEGEYGTTPLTIIVAPQQIITITRDKTQIIDDFIAGVVPTLSTQRSNFLIKMCLRMIYYYEEYINGLSRQVDSKQRLLRQIDKEDIIALVEIEEILNSYIDALTRNLSVVNKILLQKHIDLYDQDKQLIDDLVIDGEQVLDLAKTNLKTISNIREGYTTVLSLRLEQIMKVLTYVTAFFTIPMLVTSLYGMNVSLPWASEPHAFTLIVGIIIISLLAAWLLFATFKKHL